LHQLLRLTRFLKNYRNQSILALALLIMVLGGDLAIPRLIQRIVDQGITKNDFSVILSTSLIMLGITIVSTFFSIGNTLSSVTVSESFARDLRSGLFSQVLHLSYGNLDHMRTGQLMTRLTSDIAQVRQMVLISLRIGTRAPLLALGSLILMVTTSPRLSLIMLPLIIIAALMIIFFTSRIQKLFLLAQQKLDTLNNILQENLAGVRVIKAFVRGPHENERFENANVELTDQSVRVNILSSYLSPTLTLIVNLGISAVIWFGGLQAIAGNMTVGEIIAFTNYLLTTLSPLMMLATSISIIAASEASAGRINQVFDAQPEIKQIPGAQSIKQLRGKVAFEHVSFSYSDHENEPVLSHIDIDAEPGQTVAILGATGSGKTTLINMIPRFYDAVEGRVKVDGLDVRGVNQDTLLQQTGVAQQETILFSGTIAENIAYGRPKATREEVIAAAQAAQADDFIMQMPQGYDTPVAQMGVNLSGGQKQRIAIARALLINPRILILDDSTSAVDMQTEAKIQDALETVTPKRTSFIVAQRISTVLNADKIIVLENGRIVAQGNHNQLMESSPVYREIYDSQLGEGSVLHG